MRLLALLAHARMATPARAPAGAVADRAIHPLEVLVGSSRTVPLAQRALAEVVEVGRRPLPVVDCLVALGRESGETILAALLDLLLFACLLVLVRDDEVGRVLRSLFEQRNDVDYGEAW